MNIKRIIKRLRQISLIRLIEVLKEATNIIINRCLAKIVNLFKMSKNNQKELYLQMKEDLKNTEKIHSPSPLWNMLEKQFSDIMDLKGIENFKDNYINRHFAAYSPESKRVYEGFLWQYYQNIKKRDYLGLLEKIEEPTFGGKGDVVLINNKRYTSDLLQSIDEFYNIFGENIDLEKKRIIMELGSGYGRLAYVILKALPNVTYVLLDLPSSLLIAQYYLPKVLPEINYVGYNDTRLMDKIPRKELLKKRLWFFAGLKFPNFEKESIDIFVNIYSLQEMTKKQLKYYLDLVSKKTLKRVYLKQHILEDNPINSEKIKSEDYSLGGGVGC